MRKIMLVIIVVMIPTHVYASSAWEWNILGVTSKNFKGRDPIVILGGVVSSLLIHELGHMVAGELVGMDTKFKPRECVVRAYNYDDKSDNEKAFFHAGGFIAQVLVGGVLTAIPASRHHDFTLGFNGFTALNSIGYALSGGFDSETSDVKCLDYYGYDGVAIGIATGLIGGGYSYINLRNDLEKEK
jgi:hypothetical protein